MKKHSPILVLSELNTESTEQQGDSGASLALVIKVLSDFRLCTALPIVTLSFIPSAYHSDMFMKKNTPVL